MVSDQEIAKAVETVLRQSDPNTVTSVNGVVRQLEQKLGLNLSHKSGFIRDQINHLLLLRSSQPIPLPQHDRFVLQHFPQFPISPHFPHQPQFHPHFAPVQLHQQQQSLPPAPPQTHRPRGRPPGVAAARIASKAPKERCIIYLFETLAAKKVEIFKPFRLVVIELELGPILILFVVEFMDANLSGIFFFGLINM